ncbi:hypothetical protein [Glutamicibacter sp. Je.9.36]|uniref:hypothetical protein n=1 Tax=Glutamicibacter sp. Je.9.36 TaxID=3142837 RepID=UPI003DA7E117
MTPRPMSTPARNATALMYQLFVAAGMIPGASATITVSQCLRPAIRTVTDKKFRTKNARAL